MPHPRTVVVLSALLLPTALCAADVLTVDDDGPADFDSIQAAIDAASDGDEILVADGTYRSDGDQVVDPRGKRILIRAREGASPVITGDGVRRGILCRSGEGPGTLIEGFVITGCTPTWYDWNGNGEVDFWEFFGGGLWCRDGSAPTVRGCLFMDNRAEYGGAIYAGDENAVASNPLIESCLFVGNQAAPASGGVGGAVYNNASSPVILDSLFDMNRATSGGAILNWDGSDPEIVGCRFMGNTARNGGAIYNDSSQPRHLECLFVGNEASSDGGAVFNADPGGSQNVPVFERCDFQANIASDEGGAINNFSISPEITGCVLIENVADDGSAIHSWNASTPRLLDTLICSNVGIQVSGPWSDLGGNTVASSCPGDCTGDINQDGLVDGADLNRLLGDWGQSDSTADLDGNGLVDGEDLLFILGAWGPCP